MLVGVSVDHLKAVASGMRNENAAGFRIKSPVVKGATERIRYLDGACGRQRHGDVPTIGAAALRAHFINGITCLAMSARASTSYGQIEWWLRSMRKLLDESSVAQSLDGDRLMGSLRFPENVSSSSVEQMQQKLSMPFHKPHGVVFPASSSGGLVWRNENSRVRS